MQLLESFTALRTHRFEGRLTGTNGHANERDMIQVVVRSRLMATERHPILLHSNYGNLIRTPGFTGAANNPLNSLSAENRPSVPTSGIIMRCVYEDKNSNV